MSADTQRHPDRHRSRRALLGIATTVLALSGCGLRLDTPPPQAPMPDEAESLRQDAAAATARLLGTTERTDGAGPASEVLTRITRDAEAQLAALGGVWQAWPDGAPEGVTPPEPAATAPAEDPDVTDVLDLLTASAADAREAATTAPTADLAALLGSVAIARGEAAQDLAEAADAEPPESEAAPLTLRVLRQRGVDGPTVQVLDQARFAYETVAARTTGSSREDAEDRARELQSLVDGAIRLGAPDSRLEAYQLPGPDEEAGLSANQAAAVRAETLLAEHWLFSLGRAESDVRSGLLAAAADSVDRIELWGAALPALPGLPPES